MSINDDKSLRLIFPLWLGGNLREYHFGAQMLAWLAPDTPSPVELVPVTPLTVQPDVEEGILGRSKLMQDLDNAAQLIKKHQPERITVLGGDCLIDLEPFSWLSERYGEGFGILWIDTHPDVMTPAQYANAHAHILGALMGNGDHDLTHRVKRPVPASNVMIAGLHSPNAYEADFIRERGIRTVSPEAIREGSQAIAEWIKAEKITHLAIHFDLDVLDFRQFRAVMFARPDDTPEKWDGVARGKLTLSEAAAVIAQADRAADVVGLGIAEHLPWDALNLKNLLATLPLLRQA
ncbi:arginase family protein [Enterobacter sp. RHBSTW-00994]|uniref:arginase family protein n=1 Tax=Enterobacteriaceae TaxID=543 RepID=UPI0015EAD256|nr:MULTISPECIES: arginase family protein [Enterobacteriaceae]MBM3069608.1 arginase family protein [Lelliottia sp. RWM.1]QLR41987.1 arginase family protein [Enterobacter sp. RHBSTW-00994]